VNGVKFGTLGNLDRLRGTVLLRCDLNSPIDPDSGLILDDKRFCEHLPTIQALGDARCVILTHQSRPGKKDFTTLEPHAEKLSRLLSRPVNYVDDIFGRCAREEVRAMKPGDVVMLENVRFNAEENLKVSPEVAKKTHIVKNLSRMADLFVNDAFGTAHRSQPTMVGLPLAMRSVAGLLLEREVAALSRVFEEAPRPVTFVLGGTKVDDSIDVAQNVLDRDIADRVVLTGVVANVFLLARGVAIGTQSRELLHNLGYDAEVEEAKSLLDRYPDRIVLPESVAVREQGERAEYPVSRIPEESAILDLGTEAIGTITGVLKDSGTVVLNGPAGVFEDSPFALGTQEILKAAAGVEFSVVGGGHTAAVIEQMDLADRFSHISTGGGACIEFLTGRTLPAIAALEESFRIFG
jgi:phosphoglycerate kinase